MLNIFFFILIGLLLGLVLISFNLQRIMELFIVNVCLFFEAKSMKMLVLKNLSAHRPANKMTSIIFSLTLGCIIFVIVDSQLNLKLAVAGNYGDIDWAVDT